jgi:hypothetical protein
VSEDQDIARLELYKLAVEMADRTSARRAGANSFFLTLNVALAAFVGVVSSARKPTPNGDLPTFDAFGLVVTALAGVVLAVTWWALLRYYRRLNRAKFVVINAIEARLIEQPYTREWAELHPDDELELPHANEPSKKGLWSWMRRNSHREASAVEQVVPFVFVAIYIALAVRVALT